MKLLSLFVWALASLRAARADVVVVGHETPEQLKERQEIRTRREELQKARCSEDVFSQLDMKTLQAIDKLHKNGQLESVLKALGSTMQQGGRVTQLITQGKDPFMTVWVGSMGYRYRFEKNGKLKSINEVREGAATIIDGPDHETVYCSQPVN